MFYKFLVFSVLGLCLFVSDVGAKAPLSSSEELVEFVFAYDSNDGFQGFTDGEVIPEENPGYDVELLLMIEEHVPVKFRFKRMPWKRCLIQLGEGTVSGVNGSYKTEREALGVYPRLDNGDLDGSKRIASGDYVLATLKNSDLYFDHENKRFVNQTGLIAAPKGYSIVADFKGYGIDIYENSGGVQPLMNMLVLGRVQGILAHRMSIQYEMETNSKFSNIEIKNPPVKSKNYYLIIAKDFYKKHPELSQQIWDTLEMLRDKHAEDLYTKYLNLK